MYPWGICTCVKQVQHTCILSYTPHRHLQVGVGEATHALVLVSTTHHPHTFFAADAIYKLAPPVPCTLGCGYKPGSCLGMPTLFCPLHGWSNNQRVVTFCKHTWYSSAAPTTSISAIRNLSVPPREGTPILVKCDPKLLLMLTCIPRGSMADTHTSSLGKRSDSTEPCALSYAT